MHKVKRISNSLLAYSALKYIERFYAANQEANRNARRAEKVYEVEEIVGKRGRDEDVEYRVHWLGYEARHRTWEKMESLGDARAAIARFEKKFKTKR